MRRLISGPIWRKLAIGIIVFLLIPILVVISASWERISSVMRQNAESYIVQAGSHQHQQIQQNFTNVLSGITNASNTTGVRRLLTTIQAETPSPQLIETWAEQVTEVFTTLLTGPNSAVYDNLWLVDASGTLILAMGENLEYTVGSSIVGTDIFAAGETLSRIQNRSQTLFIAADETNTSGIQIINVIRRTETSILGYVVATLDTNTLVRQSLTFVDTSFPAYSFLVLPNQTFITTPNAAARVALDTDGVRRALAGETGLRTYNTGGGNPRDVIGYFAPIVIDQNTTFALVTEVSLNVASEQALAALSSIVLPAIGAIVLLAAVIVFLFHVTVAAPLNALRAAVAAVGRGDFRMKTPGDDGNDEISALIRVFVDARDHVDNMFNDMQYRLRQSNRDIEATQEISRVAASETDLNVLMNRVVNSIIEHFPNIYHAQIFLNDSDNHYAVLHASTGEVGQMLLARGHRLAVGSVSVIGQVTEQGQVIVARNTAASEVHRRNEFLPETRAELAIPLRFGDTVIGALDVQSKQSDSFKPDQVVILETLADQVTVAIRNAQLYEQSIRSLQELELRNQESSLAAWSEYMLDQRQHILVDEAGNPSNVVPTTLREAALRNKQTIVGEPTPNNTIPVIVPILYRGQALGAVEWELPEQDFDYNRVLLAEELVNRLGISLENARLFQESQRATERERLVNEISTQLVGQTDIDGILQTAVREVGKALRIPHVNIRLTWGEDNENGDHPPNGNA